jgi:hypothetical protein
MVDDRTHSEIKITTKNNEVITAYASSFGYLDFELWQIANMVCYNPNFAIIFETIPGEDSIVKTAGKRTILALDRAVYYALFHIMIK